MSGTLKQVIYWTLFIAILLIFILVILVPLFIMLYFPESEIASHFSNIIGVASTIIGALSAGLGFFSIFQANQGNKQVNKVLETVQNIESSQKAIFVRMSESGTSVAMGRRDSSEDDDWPTDNIKS